jgi:hypothetical protein
VDILDIILKKIKNNIMSLIKLAASKTDIDNYNAFKEKAGVSPYIASVGGGLVGAGTMKGLAHLTKGRATVTEMALSSLIGASVGHLTNHVRVHNKIDKKLGNKILKHELKKYDE